VESKQNVEPKTNNVKSRIAFLLQEIRKIIKIIFFLAGAPPQTPLLGSLQNLIDLRAGFEEGTSKGRGGEGSVVESKNP